jgi:hypothetical protein
MTLHQVDPFLRLVDDCKLEAVNAGLDHLIKVYGSKEDDEDALKSLSATKITESQCRESFATMIVQTLGKSSDVTPISHSHNIYSISSLSCNGITVLTFGSLYSMSHLLSESSCLVLFCLMTSAHWELSYPQRRWDRSTNLD